jgi:hypothetical protein
MLISSQILAILIIGERNFFSTQVDYQTEPIVSVGKLLSLLPHMFGPLTTSTQVNGRL